jgi:hypothetical protein
VLWPLGQGHEDRPEEAAELAGDRGDGDIPVFTLVQAVVHLLETEYRILGSHRMLEQLAEDMEELNRQYFGEQSKMAPGVLCWRTQSIDDQKFPYAKRTEDYKSKTIYLPLVEMEDVQERMHHRKGIRNGN